MLNSWTLAPLDLSLDCPQLWILSPASMGNTSKLLHASYRFLAASIGSQGTIIGSLIAPWCPLCSLLHQHPLGSFWVSGHQHRELFSALVPTMLPASPGLIQGIPAHSGSTNWLHKFIGATTAPCSSTGVCVAPCGCCSLWTTLKGDFRGCSTCY